MTTLDDLRWMVEKYNKLTGLDVSIFHYWRAVGPYALTLNGNTLVRGTKNDLFLFLDGAITGINTFAAHCNIRIAE
jgi:hypothetical protein